MQTERVWRDHVILLNCPLSSCEGHVRNSGGSNVHNQCYLFCTEDVSSQVLSDFIGVPLSYTCPKQRLVFLFIYSFIYLSWLRRSKQ